MKQKDSKSDKILGLYKNNLIELQPDSSGYYSSYKFGRSQPLETYDKIEFISSFDGWMVYINKDNPDLYILGEPIEGKAIYIEGVKCKPVAKANDRSGIFVRCSLKFTENQNDKIRYNELFLQKMKNLNGPAKEIPYPKIRRYYSKKQQETLLSYRGVIEICKEFLPYILIKEECLTDPILLTPPVRKRSEPKKTMPPQKTKKQEATENLWKAVYDKNAEEKIHQFVNQGAELTMRDPEDNLGITLKVLLHMKPPERSRTFIYLLKQKHVRRYDRTPLKESAYHIAARLGDIDIIKNVDEHINSRTLTGYTALMYAIDAEENCIAIIKSLLNKRADINIISKEGTALDIAIAGNKMEIADFIRSNGGLSELEERTRREQNASQKIIPEVLGNKTDEGVVVLRGSYESLCSSLEELPLTVTKLVIDCPDMEILPDLLFECTSLRELRIESEKLKRIPQMISKLINLEKLAIHSPDLTDFPFGITGLIKLTHIDLENSPVKFVPSKIGLLEKLEYINLAWTKTESIPDRFGTLRNLKALDMRGTLVKTLPNRFKNLENLKYLNLSWSSIEKLPDGVQSMHLLWNEKGIFLEHCENLICPPYTVFEEGREAVFDFFFWRSFYEVKSDLVQMRNNL